jgi:hypothetical protein
LVEYKLEGFWIWNLILRKEKVICHLPYILGGHRKQSEKEGACL